MSDPWFKFYASDWLGGTRGLTSSETGIYITLVAMMYERGEALHRDDKRLSRLCGCTKASFTKAVDALIYEDKITLVDGALSNNRVEKERKNRQEKSQKASLSAQERWRAEAVKTKQKQQSDDADAFQDGCETDAIPDTRGQKPDKKDTNVSTKNAKSKIPDDWVPSEEDHAYALSKQISHSNIEELANEFQAYWFDRNDRDSKKSQRGWSQCWQSHVRRAASRPEYRNLAGGQKTFGYGQGGGIADIAAQRRSRG